MNKDYLTALSLGRCLRGTQPEQYEIVKVLGAGAFGITYKAKDRVLGGEVAIKEYFPNEFAVRQHDGVTVSPRTSSDRGNYEWGLSRFLEEAQTLARFKEEPNIVRVISYVEEHGTAYIIMDYVEGESLADYLSRLERQGLRMNEAQLRQLFVPLLDGLRVVHEAEYLHQDIKPANIYIRKGGRPILLDFGGAREALGEHSQSMSRIFTEGYAPYEQFSGNRKVATDLYAVGATLYRCITGAAPVSSLSRGEMILEGELDPLVLLSNLKPQGFSDDLLHLIDALLSFRTKDRPQSVEEVLAKLLPQDLGEGDHAPIIDDKLQSPVDRSEPSDKNECSANKEVDHDRVQQAVAQGSQKGLGVFALFFIVAAIVGYYFYDQSQQQRQTVQQTTIQNSPVASIAQPSPPPKPKPQPQLSPLQQLIKKAEEGDADSQYSLGFKYAEGDGVPRDYSKAFKWYSQAANQGHRYAQNNLGVLYKFGRGVSKDWGKAAEWYRKSAEKGNPVAQVNLGLAFEKGEGVPKNQAEAVKWFRLAADQNDLRGQYNLGWAYVWGDGAAQQLDKGLELLRAAAQRDHSASQVALGRLYLNGHAGVKQNYKEAFKWYKKAADQGSAHGQYSIGYMYEKGRSVKKDRREALEWYKKSEAKGHKEAKRAVERLEKYFADGDSVDANLRAAERGDLKAQLLLAESYRNGRGVKADLNTAEKWYLKAAEQGDLQAQLKLAGFYEHAKRDFNSALLWYKKAVATGDAKAITELGELYYFGTGYGNKNVGRNAQKAYEQFKKAAEMDHGIAQAWLGSMYEKNFTPPKIDKAIAWYKEAIKHPDSHYKIRDAKKNLKSLEETKRLIQLGKGKLTVRSNVNGDKVYINGKSYGSTRLDLELKPGSYNIKVEKNGKGTKEKQIRLSRGDQETVWFYF